MLGRDAAVLDRHFPAGERDQLGAQADVLSVREFLRRAIPLAFLTTWPEHVKAVADAAVEAARPTGLSFVGIDEHVFVNDTIRT
jgi:hypothetical protein